MRAAPVAPAVTVLAVTTATVTTAMVMTGMVTTGAGTARRCAWAGLCLSTLVMMSSAPPVLAKRLAQGDASDGAVAPPVVAQVTLIASRIGEDEGTAQIDAAMVARTHAPDLLDLLNSVPGVRATRLGGPAGPSFLSIRGGEGNFTAVMIDGVRLNDPSDAAGGAFDFALIDPALVQRVEVVRGGASAVQGADALAGVVQIITRAPADTGVIPSGAAWLDSQGAGAVSAAMSAGWGGGGLLVGGGHSASAPDDPSGHLRRDQWMAHATQRLAGGRLNALGLVARVDGRGFPQDSGGVALAVVRAFEVRENDLSVAGLSYRADAGPGLRPQLAISHALTRQHMETPAIAPGVLDGVPAMQGRTRFARLDASAALAIERGPHRIAWGGALVREDGDSQGHLDYGFPLPVSYNARRTTYSGFAEALVRPHVDVKLTGALRYDDTLGNGRWTGRGGLVWSPESGGISGFFRIATAYKLPSLYALGHPLIGNVDLRPETGRGGEAGVQIDHAGRRMGVTLFQMRFRDLVDFDPSLFRLVNRSRVETRGVELDARGAVTRHLGISGALTYLDVKSATPMRGRPRWAGRLTAGWQHERWEVQGILRANSGVHDSSIPTGPTWVAGHIDADVSVRFTPNARLELGAAVLNLGDRRNWVAVGTAQAGRRLHLSLRLR